MKILTKIALVAVFGFALCFAQEAPEKLAVYVSGASAGINKSLSNKLLMFMSQSGEYAEIADPDSFQDELSKSGKGDIAKISQAAKRYGADYVCVVSMTEVFGAYSITARLIKIIGSQVIKTGSADRALKSLEDLTAVSYELAHQLLTPSFAPPAAVSVAPVAAPVVQPSFEVLPETDSAPAPTPVPEVIDRVAAAQKQCSRTYNINELLFNLKEGFPNQLKDCASKLAKDMLTPAMLGGKKLGEPKSFMKQCTVDGISNEIPDGFPNADKIVGSVDNFVQSILNSASAADGGLNPKKLMDAVGSISVSINTLLSDVKKLSSNRCVVNEPYEPPADDMKSDDEVEESNFEFDKSDESSVSFGIRIGFNFSSEENGLHDVTGMQVGILFDFAKSASAVLHFQPGLMYIQKGMVMKDDYITAHYLEIPILLSLKFSALRLGAGPYIGICLSDNGIFKSNDIGISMGLGLDIKKFYMGIFYDYGLVSVGSYGLKDDYYKDSHNIFNRTLGFNIGVNF